MIEYRSGAVVERRYLNDQLVQNTYDPTTRQSRSLFTGALQWLAHAYGENRARTLYWHGGRRGAHAVCCGWN